MIVAKHAQHRFRATGCAASGCPRLGPCCIFAELLKLARMSVGGPNDTERVTDTWLKISIDTIVTDIDHSSEALQNQGRRCMRSEDKMGTAERDGVGDMTIFSAQDLAMFPTIYDADDTIRMGLPPIICRQVLIMSTTSTRSSAASKQQTTLAFGAPGRELGQSPVLQTRPALQGFFPG